MITEAIIERIMDRYTASELVEILTIDIDTLMEYIRPYIEDNIDIFSEEMREYFNGENY